jgi:epoxide hydrolase 4
MANAATLSWRHEFVETNQIRLHCVTQGEGELVILLHGFLEFWYSWRHQIPQLARHFKVVAPDLRGYNDSDKPQSGYDLETLGKDIHGLIQALGYKRARVVGHGWGGAIAWQLAEQFPDSIESVVLLSAPHPRRFVRDALGNMEQFLQSWYIWAAQVPNFPESLLSSNLNQLLRELFQRQSVRKGAFTTEDTAMYQAALEKPGALRSALSHSRQLLSPHAFSLPWLNNSTTQLIQRPALVLWGKDDTLFSCKLTKGMERFFSGPLQIRLISDCGHWVNQEAPQTVNRELTQFLRKY